VATAGTLNAFGTTTTPLVFTATTDGTIAGGATTYFGEAALTITPTITTDGTAGSTATQGGGNGTATRRDLALARQLAAQWRQRPVYAPAEEDAPAPVRTDPFDDNEAADLYALDLF
jgi:hypothetical protein